MLNILLIILALALLFILAAWPKIGLYLLVFFLPFIGWSINWHSLVIPWVDLEALAVLSAWLLRLLSQTIFPSQSRPIRPVTRWPLIWPFFIFITFSFVSAIFSQQVGVSFWYVVRWPLFLYLAFIFLPYNLIENKKDLKRTLWVLLGSVLLVLISGYLSFYGQNWHNSFFQINTISFFGVYPFGDNHNLIAEFLNAGAFIILALKAWSANLRLKRLLDIFFLITVIAIILTFSRAAWITIILQISIYAWYYLKKKNYSSRSIAAATALILILILPLTWKMSLFQQNNNGSTSSRWLLTEISWQAFLNRPYFGYGGGQFPNLVADNTRYIAQYGSPIDAHGFLQKILAENGVLGLAAWLFIIVSLFKEASRSIKKYQKDYPWLLPLWLAGGGALFFQIFNTSYYKGKIWLPLALALVAVCLIQKEHERLSSEKN